MSTAAPGLVGDELDLIRRLLPPAGARVADIGCGAAPLSRRLPEGGIARVLVPGGWLYVSEPVFAGPLNELMRLFHDEQAVRAAALAQLRRRFQEHLGPGGARFVRPMRANLLRRPAE